MLNLRAVCLLFVFSLPLTALAQDINEELLAAARKSDIVKVKELLAKGANVNAKSPYGATPLFFACDRGNVEVIKILLESGADANIQDTFYHATPLGWAMNKGKPEIIKLLVEAGAKDLNQAMNFAINGNHLELVKVTLAKATFKQDDLDKYLRAANKKGQKEIAESLKAAGAKELTEIKLDPETLKMYEGMYKNERFSLNFKIKDGKLTVSSDGFESAVTPLRQHTFEVEQATGITAIFNLEGDKVVSVNWKSANGEFTLKKGEAK